VCYNVPVNVDSCDAFDKVIILEYVQRHENWPLLLPELL
jgi:hypothetical protein